MKDVTKLNRRKTRCSQTALNADLAVYSRGDDRRIDQTHWPEKQGLVISKEGNQGIARNIYIGVYKVLVVCVGVVYEEYDSSLFRHIAKELIRSVLND